MKTYPVFQVLTISVINEDVFTFVLFPCATYFKTVHMHNLKFNYP